MEQNKIKEFFSDDRLAKHLNITIVEAEKHTAKCKMKIDENLLNANDKVHGGALFSLADFTFAVAANAEYIMTDSSKRVVSQLAEIQYLKPASGTEITATAERRSGTVVKPKYAVVIIDDKGARVAVAIVQGHEITL